MSAGSACPICAAATVEAFRARVLGEHDASYRHCRACAYLYADQPWWLEQAYSSAIAHADTGLVARNLQLSERLSAVLPAFFDLQGRFLDLAGGTGLLVRLMRDRGLDYFWDDRYCENQHAVGFSAAPGEGGFEAASAFEALEHMLDPMAFVAEALQRTRTRTLIFTTELHGGTPPPADWWYYVFGTGQHIAFFSRGTLEYMAQRLNCNLVSAYGLHMLSGLPVPEWRYRLALRRLAPYYRRRLRKTLGSRTERDHRLLLSRAADGSRP